MKKSVSINMSEDNYEALKTIMDIVKCETGLDFKSLDDFLSSAFENEFIGFRLPHKWLLNVFD